LTASAARREALLWVAQRASAGVLAVCVLVHLATIVYAVRGGLSAAEILARTRGSVAWGAFYATFALAVAVHAPIGLRAVVAEWLGWRGATREWFTLLLALVLAVAGLRAVFAVIAG
jgi:fumarate reductase subunit C